MTPEQEQMLARILELAERHGTILTEQGQQIDQLSSDIAQVRESIAQLRGALTQAFEMLDRRIDRLAENFIRHSHGEAA